MTADWSDRLPPAAALVDLFVDDVPSALGLLGELAEIIPDAHVNVFSLGPPLRLQLPPAALVHVMDTAHCERVRVLQWPFTQPVASRRRA